MRIRRLSACRLVSGLVFCSALAGLLPASEAQAAQIAVLPVLGYGVPSDKLEELEVLLQPAVQAAAGVILQQDETAALLAAAEEAAGCPRTQEACLVELGGLMAVSQLVVAKAKEGGSGLELTLSVFDVGVGHEERRVTGKVDRSGDQRPQQIRALVFRLFHDSLARLGGLLVEVDVEGAEVFVDGISRGRSPLQEPIYGLEAGQHTIRAEKAPFPALEKELQLGPGATLQIRLTLDPDPTETGGIDPVALQSFGWGTLGVGSLVAGGAGLIAVGCAGVSLAVIYLNLDQIRDFANVLGRCYFGAPCEAKKLQTGRSDYVATAFPTWLATGVGAPATLLAMFGLGLMAAGVGVLIFAFTDEPPPTVGAASVEAADVDAE